MIIRMVLDFGFCIPCSGAQVDLEGANGRTPLHEAANAGHCEVIKVLMSNQADPMLRDSSNDMPYDLAFKNDDKEVDKFIHARDTILLVFGRFLLLFVFP